MPSRGRRAVVVMARYVGTFGDLACTGSARKAPSIATPTPGTSSRWGPRTRDGMAAGPARPPGRGAEPASAPRQWSDRRRGLLLGRDDQLHLVGGGAPEGTAGSVVLGLDQL